MLPTQNTRILLDKRPAGHTQADTFRIETVPINDLKVGDEQVLIKTTWISLDPGQRSWLDDARSYLPPVEIGEVMRAQGLGRVISVGPNSKFQVGDIVFAFVGWQEYLVLPDKDVQKISPPKGAEPLDFLNNLGLDGFTAYFGLKDIADLKAGETLIVSGAAGAVGSLVCQLGKRAGAKVYGIAGSHEKCEWLEKELGVEKALNYKSSTFKEDFEKVGYLDVFFDNVGGDILDLALTRLNKNARIVLCGAISAYNTPESPKGIKGYLNLIFQRAKMQGFIVMDNVSRYPEAFGEIAKLFEDGSIKRKFHIVEGLEKAPSAFSLLFSGGNTGKLVVKVAE